MLSEYFAYHNEAQSYDKIKVMARKCHFSDFTFFNLPISS